MCCAWAAFQGFWLKNRHIPLEYLQGSNPGGVFRTSRIFSCHACCVFSAYRGEYRPFWAACLLIPKATKAKAAASQAASPPQKGWKLFRLSSFLAQTGKPEQLSNLTLDTKYVRCSYSRLNWTFFKPKAFSRTPATPVFLQLSYPNARPCPLPNHRFSGLRPKNERTNYRYKARTIG